MDVTVYTTPTCPYCHQVKEFLSRRGVPFREYDVSVDAAAAAEMVRLTGQYGVPVTVIDGQAVVGFDRARLEALLGARGRVRLGAAVADAADMAAQGRCAVHMGAYIGRIAPGGVAERAGLRVGDVIISLAGQGVRDAAHLEALVGPIRPRQRVPIEYVRGEERLMGLLEF